MKLLSLVLICLLPSCASYIVVANGEPRCHLTSNAPTGQKGYASLNECRESKEYLEKEIQFKKFYVYSKKSYDLNTAEQVTSFYCSSMASERFLKPINPAESFSTFDECSNSNAIKEEIAKEKKRIEGIRSSSRQRQQANEQRRISEIEKYLEKNPKFMAFKHNAIKKEISMGMPEELVILSWGKPQSVNTTVTSRRVHKQMVYGRRNYVYVDNGVVTSWQN